LKTGIPNNQVYILIDGRVILIARLVFSWEMSLYAFVTLFTWGLVADYILEGPSNVLKAIVNDTDPKAFAVIAQGHQTRGGMLRKTVRMANNP